MDIYMERETIGLHLLMYLHIPILLIYCLHYFFFLRKADLLILQKSNIYNNFLHPGSGPASPMRCLIAP